MSAAAFRIGPFQIDLIRDGTLQLRPKTFVRIRDGKIVEKRENDPMQPRILIDFNALLIRGKNRVVVVDPGTGDKRQERLIRDYRLEWPRKFFPGLEELGVRREDVDTVILTHLHWDHAGGATVYDSNGKPVPAFPNARYMIHKRELAAARQAVARGEQSYIPDDYEPLLEAGKVELVGDTAEILPGVSVRWTGGHSPGHQMVLIDGGSDGRAVYPADVLPTPALIPLDSAMSFDCEFNELCAAKKRVLSEAAEKHDLILFVHAPRQRAGYVEGNPESGFRFLPAN